MADRVPDQSGLPDPVVRLDADVHALNAAQARAVGGDDVWAHVPDGVDQDVVLTPDELWERALDRALTHGDVDLDAAFDLLKQTRPLLRPDLATQPDVAAQPGPDVDPAKVAELEAAIVAATQTSEGAAARYAELKAIRDRLVDLPKPRNPKALGRAIGGVSAASAIALAVLIPRQAGLGQQDFAAARALDKQTRVNEVIDEVEAAAEQNPGAPIGELFDVINSGLTNEELDLVAQRLMTDDFRDYIAPFDGAEEFADGARGAVPRGVLAAALVGGLGIGIGSRVSRRGRGYSLEVARWQVKQADVVQRRESLTTEMNDASQRYHDAVRKIAELRAELDNLQPAQAGADNPTETEPDAADAAGQADGTAQQPGDAATPSPNQQPDN